MADYLDNRIPYKDNDVRLMVAIGVAAAAVADFHERYATVEDAPAVWSQDGIVSSHRLSESEHSNVTT